MDEAGARVVANSSAMQGQGGVAQGQRVDTGNANIDGVRLHVQAVSSYTRGAGAEEFIAPRGAIAADDVDLGVGAAEGSGKIRKNVVDMRIVVLDLTSAVVAQEMVELIFGLREEVISAAIDNIDALAGVCVLEAKMVFLARRRGSG